MTHSKFIFQGEDLGFWKLQTLIGCDKMDDISIKIMEQNGDLVDYVDNFNVAMEMVVNRYEYAMFFLWDIELVWKETKKPISKQRLKKLFCDSALTTFPTPIGNGNREIVAKIFNSYWDRNKYHMNAEHRSKYKENR